MRFITNKTYGSHSSVSKLTQRKQTETMAKLIEVVDIVIWDMSSSSISDRTQI